MNSLALGILIVSVAAAGGFACALAVQLWRVGFAIWMGEDQPR